MTVATQTNKITYQGNGVVREWGYTFPVVDANHLKLVLTGPDGITQTIASGYTVDLIAKKVIYPVSGNPLAAGNKLTLIRILPLVQERDLINQGRMEAEGLERSFDLATMQIQQLNEAVNRSIKVSVGEADPDPQLISKMFKASADAQSAAVASKAAQGASEVARDQSKASATASAASAAASEASRNVSDASKNTAVAKAAEATAKAAESAASATAAKTSEVSALSSKTDAATSAAAAKASETNAKTSEVNAKASETSALASKNAAAASASAAKVSETNAKTSETNAKASEVASAASAAAAQVSETSAATSKNAAAGSASAAATSAANAKTSETNAKASEVSAIAADTRAQGAAYIKTAELEGNDVKFGLNGGSVVWLRGLVSKIIAGVNIAAERLFMWGKVKVGTVVIEATTERDALELKGSGAVIVTGDATTKAVTVTVNATSAVNSSSTTAVASAAAVKTAYDAAADAKKQALTVRGAYTNSGGRIQPADVPVNTVQFNMMNEPLSGNSDFKDCLIMNCYNNYDVQYKTMFAITKCRDIAGQTPVRAWICSSSMADSTWERNYAELVTSLNSTTFPSGSISTRDSNEVMIGTGFAGGSLWVNYRATKEGASRITEYVFGDGTLGGLAYVTSGGFIAKADVTGYWSGWHMALVSRAPDFTGVMHEPSGLFLGLHGNNKMFYFGDAQAQKYIVSIDANGFYSGKAALAGAADVAKSCSGNAATATRATTAGVADSAKVCTGNAATATRATTANNATRADWAASAGYASDAPFKPKAAAGVGQWTNFRSRLPAGGTWAYLVNSSQARAGVAAGGSLVADGQEGLAWRIA